MGPLQVIRSAMARRGLPMAQIPPVLFLYVVFVDLVVAVASVSAVVTNRYSTRDGVVFGLLLVLALAFEEGATRIARLQLRFSSQLKRDMTSVWAVAAGVSLSAGAAVLLLAGLFAHVWFRQQRAAKQPFYRTYFTTSSAVLGCLLAGMAVRGLTESTPMLPWGLTSAVAVLLAIVIYTGVNRVLVTGALLGVGVRGKDLIGSRDANLAELSTLCLGGLVAVAAVHEPWLCVLVIAPMIALQRGAFVRELETAAITDAKTGLLNAVAWEQLAQRELTRAAQVSESVAVLIVDIDRFKAVNDRYGHLVGDVVLRGIGKSLTESLREFDGLGRFGGEEFVAVLPGADAPAALVVAERIRATVNRLAVADFEHGLPVDLDSAAELLSVSIGVAVSGQDGEELNELLYAADQALYRAKVNGRNQVQLAGGGGDTPDRVLS